jgi:hypothetical protein
MTKSIAISSLVLGIAIFAASIFSLSTTSSNKHHNTVSYNDVAIVHQSPATVGVSSDFVPTTVSFKTTHKPTKATKKASRVTMVYNHSLEQGGSPMAPTVRVIENL